MNYGNTYAAITLPSDDRTEDVARILGEEPIFTDPLANLSYPPDLVVDGVSSDVSLIQALHQQSASGQSAYHFSSLEDQESSSLFEINGLYSQNPARPAMTYSPWASPGLVAPYSGIYGTNSSQATTPGGFDSAIVSPTFSTGSAYPFPEMLPAQQSRSVMTPRTTSSESVGSAAHQPRRSSVASRTSSQSSREKRGKHQRQLSGGHQVSKKSRQRTRTQEHELEATERELEDQNSKLRGQVAVLKGEVLNLKSEILKHAACNNTLIHEYIVLAAAQL